MRNRKATFIGALALVVAGAMSPAASAQNHSDDKPTAKSFLHKGLRAARGNNPGIEDEDNEAELIKLRAEFAQSIQSAPGTTIPVAGVLAAQRAAGRLPVVGGRWTSPTDKPFLNDPINRGFNYGVGHGVVTGRMTALTASGGTVYAGSASGGVWRSSDKGGHWHTVNNGLPRLSVGAIATDPGDGSIWVGTGEANNAGENQYGTGVYRLAPGSSRWQKIGGRELFGAGSYTILWARDHVYIATSHGLYRRSADAPRSASWKPVLQPNGPKKYPPSSSVTDVVAVPGTHGGKLLAVVGWAGYTNPPDTDANGFYVGSGSAGSFERITPTGDIDPADIGRTSFSSSHGWLYALVTSDSAANEGTLIGEGVFVSRHGPVGPWKKIATTNELADADSAMEDASTTFFPGVQGDYNQQITADPANPRHVYLQLEEVYESVDAGMHWKTVGPYWNFDIECEEQNGDPYDCPRTTHPDQHAAMIYRGAFWAGSDGGLWRRPLSWHDKGHWTDLNATLHTTQNYSVDVGQTADGYAYWGGLQDNGESYTRPDMDHVEQAFTGDGGDTIVAPYFGDEGVVEYVYLDMYMSHDGFVADASEISPSCITASDPPDPCDPNPRFIAPMEKDIKDATHWVAGGQYVWKDNAGWNTVCNGTDGCDWQPVYDTGSGHSVTALARSGSVIYAGFCGPCNPSAGPGGSPFQRGLATNYGGSWHRVTLHGAVPGRYITSIAVDPSNAAHAYISLGSYSQRWIPKGGYGHVFETRDGGATWADVSGDLPDAPVYHVALAGHRLVAGTEVGAFIAPTGGSHGDGLSWARLGHGLPKVTVWDVVTRPDGLVVAGTHGRGDWKINLN